MSYEKFAKVKAEAQAKGTQQVSGPGKRDRMRATLFGLARMVLKRKGEPDVECPVVEGILDLQTGRLSDCWAEVPGYVASRTGRKMLELLAPEPVTIFDPERVDLGCRRGSYEVPACGEGKFHVKRIKLGQLKFGDDPDAVLAAIEAHLGRQPVQMAIVAGDGILYAGDEGGEWGDGFEDIEVRAGSKTGKRMKSALGGHPFTATLDAGEVNLDILDYGELPGDESEDDKKKLYDGAGFISRELVERIVSVKEVVLSGDPVLDAKARARVDRFKARARHSKVFRVRAWTAAGMVKMHALVRPQAELGADIVTVACNVKAETAAAGGKMVLALTPEVCSDQVRTNVQAMLSLPELFPLDRVAEWATWYAHSVYAKIVSQQLPMTMKEIYELEAKTLEKDDEIDEGTREILLQRWSAMRIFGMGYDFRHSPALAESMARGHLQNLVGWDGNKLKLRVPVPCALDRQVVSNSYARLCGFDVTVVKGTIRVLRGFPFAVVSDGDWLESYDSHGGCDMDDHFMLFYWIIAGEKKVVVMRNPSDRGEYSVYSFVAGDEEPASEVWPLVNGVRTMRIAGWLKAEGMAKAAPRYSECLADGRCRVVGLPEAAGDAGEGERYHYQHFLKDIEVALHSVNPGSWVNTIMLWNSVFPGYRDVRMCSMEAGIDASTQAKLKGLKECLEVEQQYLREQMIYESEAPIDSLLFGSLSSGWKKEEIELVEHRLVEGDWTQLVKGIETMVEDYLKKVSAWAQQVHEMPACLVAKAPTGQEKLRLKDKILVSYRRAVAIEMAAARKEGRPVNKEVSKALAAATRQAVGKDLAAFAWVCHWWETSEGKISDRLLLTEKFLANYLEVLKAGAKVEAKEVGLSEIYPPQW